jgi:hypothetical protein
LATPIGVRLPLYRHIEPEDPLFVSRTEKRFADLRRVIATEADCDCFDESRSRAVTGEQYRGVSPSLPGFWWASGCDVKPDLVLI